MDHDQTPSASSGFDPDPADLQVDWDGWRREVRSFCSVLRRQIGLATQGLTAHAAAEASRRQGVDEQAFEQGVPPAGEDRLTLLKRQLDYRIQSQ